VVAVLLATAGARGGGALGIGRASRWWGSTTSKASIHEVLTAANDPFRQ
jgi:hypothetical protein